ncbi:protein MEI2-like 5 isoform X2 [Physcomitrium patens]|nr:protein terminal ear1 homolog isoform X2 [Physcomitrium patens]XP_024383881.1 protein terminal ear1 homolog isoform X2 [Physcomitrium patens]XP_024383882.1 protein terminal ear1 homolog isoform X2 [Physcomitrium patens]XP_024383883.1 protein terminal ear1 homolog isoform X2 [Physcomitrium patens]AEN71548.1 terminal EAR1-like 2 [Physcomitrium patens]|eukprot:XP_024383880.1 protein terminal ear1 homolog isoform X2 [Physcomitrella patens]
MGGDRTESGGTSTYTNDNNIHYDDVELTRDAFQRMGCESGEFTDSAPEGIAAGETGLQVVENGALSSSLELSRQPDNNIDVDYVTQQQQQQQQQQPQHGLGHGHGVQYSGIPRGFDLPLPRAHECRPPPALHLPDQRMMDGELADLQHEAHREVDYSQSSNFSLPITLAVSPGTCHASCHDAKASLDPNAREYTPNGPSPCISPGVPPPLLQHHIGVPSSYSFESGHIYVSGVDSSRMIYSPTYGSDTTISLYGNGAQIAYVPVSAPPSAPWGGIEIPDLSQQVSQSATAGHLSVTPVGLPGVQSSHALRSFGIPPFQAMGLPSLGISSNNILSTPPISGREHVSRAILLNGVPASLSDEQLKVEMGKWGDVRTIVSDRKLVEGLVTVNFYDLRCAKDALRDIQQQHLNKQHRMQQQYQLSQKQRGVNSSSSSRENADMAFERQDAVKHPELLPESTGSSSMPSHSAKGLVCGIVMWAQYTLPIGAAAGPDGLNQGTLVVFNLDVDTTMECLKSVFEVYGDVKELRETPAKKQHKFVEFFDVRDAAKALKALDGTEIHGKRVKIEFSRPGGQAHKARVQLQQRAQGSSVYNSIASSLPSLAGAGPVAVAGQPLYAMGTWSGDAACGPVTMPGAHGAPPACLWSPNIGTPVSPLGLVQAPWSSGAGQLQTYNYTSMQGGPANPAGSLVVVGNMNALSFGRAGGRALTMPYTGASASPGENYAPSRAQGSFGSGSGSTSGQGRVDGISSRRSKRNSSVNGNAGFGKVDSASHLGSGGKLREGPRVGTRISTNKLASRADIPPQYIFDESGVQTNDTHRTTLMIKNIPNKYSQQMLLSLLDTHCIECNKRLEDPNDPKSAYDFVYLPIDFKNRCNLGYAFVNFTTVQATMRLYRAFHLQQWEEFNSRKVCHVTYARVQGRAALEEHFKNSRFACDTDDYLPLMFRPPRNGVDSTQTITVAAVHQSSRALGNTSEDREHGRGPRNGERTGDERRILGNGCSGHELEMGQMPSGQSRGSSSSGVHRSSMPQQHR